MSQRDIRSCPSERGFTLLPLEIEARDEHSMSVTVQHG